MLQYAFESVCLMMIDMLPLICFDAWMCWLPVDMFEIDLSVCPMMKLAEGSCWLGFWFNQA